MPHNLRNIFHNYNVYLAEIAGQNFSVRRPDYTITNGTPTVVHTQKKFKCEKTGPRLGQPGYSGVEYYAIFGNRNLFSPGDLLVPLESTSSTPIVTVLSYSPLEECVGFRTSRLGEIRNGTTVIYSNVYFDFISSSAFPGAQLNREVESSLEIPSKKITIYKRNLATLTRQDEGLLFVEMDTDEKKRWKIEQIDDVGNMSVLIVKEALDV